MSSTEKPTVVIVMPLAEQRGGAELSLLHLVQNEREVHWHVVFLEDGPMVQHFRDLGYPAEVILAGRVRQPLKVISAIRKIARLARQVNAKAMLGWMAKAHLYSGSAAILVGIPAVWFQHGLPTKGGVIDELANRIPAIGALACSQFSADAQHVVTPKLPIKVVYAPTNLKQFDPANLPRPADCRQMLGLPNDGPIIGIFGRLQKWKGMHTLILAMPEVLKLFPTATALVVGGLWQQESDYEKSLHDLAESKGIAKSVVFAGHQTNIAHWMQACDIIVHASDREPFGMVVVEAMALGKPVIAGSTGGPREVISDQTDGYLVDYEDTATMVDRMSRLLSNPEAAGNMGELARIRARQFSLEQFADSVSREMIHWIYSR